MQCIDSDFLFSHPIRCTIFRGVLDVLGQVRISGQVLGHFVRSNIKSAKRGHRTDVLV